MRDSVYLVLFNDSGYIYPYLLLAETDIDAEKKAKGYVKSSRLGNGYAKVKSITRLTHPEREEKIFSVDGMAAKDVLLYENDD